MLALLGASSAQALTLQPVGSFDQPIYLTSDPGDAGRLFVVEREGTVQLVEGGVRSPFADLRAKVACCEGERGLFSIALDPDFDLNGRLFAAYTGEEEPGEVHVDELLASGPGHKSAVFVKNLFTVPHGAKTTHNGGQLQFGPDGYLYLSTGDGGGANDELHNAQDPASPLGKVLRVDVDTGAYEIWSSGLRNPFRFSFDRLSGNMVIGDVGQSLREEIDLAPSPFPGVVGGENANYGWNCREGSLLGPQGAGVPDPECATPPLGGFTEPVFEYSHAPDPDLGNPRCSITGGYVIRDPALGGLNGRYLYADYCAGALRSLRLPTTAAGQASEDCWLGLQVDHPVSFGEDTARRLYVVAKGGDVFRLAGQPPANCLPPPPAAAGPPLSPTFVGIKAQRRRVERGKAAVLTVWVSPCNGRKGDAVALVRNGHRNGSKFLNRACTARFLRRVFRGTSFAASTHQDLEYLPGESRHLRVRLAPHRRRG
ncbi:MAG TPA: PQQ-dependent sugar dehydrogenase [Solirubrobacterales bacterium]|nr:PQQ-dependent sugar dehydrogenase [Solirubrobacterales bacterium]